MDALNTPMKIGPHTVPGLWRHMLPHELALLRIPTERRATCQNCPRVVSDDYRPDYRCCTYHPRVPNFLLGLALEDRRARAAIEKTRADGWLLPEGFQATPQQWALFLADVAEERFGKSEQVLCPFLEPRNGFCKIYAYRNSVCSTFFCHTDHKALGQNFWDALQTCVLQVEMALGQWALAQVGFDVKAYIRRLDKLAGKVAGLARDGSGCWTEETRRHLWGEHFGRELEVYEECGHAIRRHKDELWELANATAIHEASTYEEATHGVVPRKYQDQIEDDYSDDSQVTASPASLWSEVMRHHRALWRLPGGKVHLSRRAWILPNDHGDRGDHGGRAAAEARYHAHKTHVIALRIRRNSSQIIWREFLSKEIVDALNYFRQPVFLTHRVMTDLRRILHDDVEGFVAEWVAKKILVAEPIAGASGPEI